MTFGLDTRFTRETRGTDAFDTADDLVRDLFPHANEAIARIESAFGAHRKG